MAHKIDELDRTKKSAMYCSPSIVDNTRCEFVNAKKRKLHGLLFFVFLSCYFTFSHFHIFTYSHFHIFTYSHITFSHFHIFTFSHFHIFTIFVLGELHFKIQDTRYKIQEQFEQLSEKSYRWRCSKVLL